MECDKGTEGNKGTEGDKGTGDKGTYPHVTPSMLNRRIRFLHVFILRQQHVNVPFFLSHMLARIHDGMWFLDFGF